MGACPAHGVPTPSPIPLRVPKEGRNQLNEGITPLLTGIGERCSQTILKVPKREIFDRSDFPDFYTIKSLRVGDLGVKIKKCYKIFRGSFRGAKFLKRMLSVFLRRLFF